ncbi:glucosamine 6-phosphate N-acetyltransferase [Neoconidiobolus thromboides FSU 785]|nr:glucosamine 6-phosphate N-acetyltransferase [Neoconidiobolus thromboides FSU 785]
MNNYLNLNTTSLFTESLISPEVKEALPKGYVMRPLELGDYDKGYIQCLSQLTVTGNVTRQMFNDNYERILKAGNYYSLVIEDTEQKKIVAAGTLLTECKFIRSCGLAGHIEDIVVHDSQRGKKLGLRVIDALKYIGVKVGCYKIILNCSESNVPFYEKCGFKVKDFQMTIYPAENQIATTISKSQL